MKRYWLFSSIIALLTFGTAFADSLPINQLPMYGEREKTVEMRMLTRPLLRRSRSKDFRAKKARNRSYSPVGRIGQNAILPPRCHVLTKHGCLIQKTETRITVSPAVSVCGGTPSEVEHLFQLATSKPNVIVAFVDYGRVPRTQKQLGP